MTSSACEFCGYDVPLERESCPHCGRACSCPPNVRAAQQDAAREALDRRYQAAQAAAATRGAEAVVQSFKDATQTSKAVIGRPLRDIERLASSDRELYATYYGLTQAEARLSFGDKWDALRGLADQKLFPGYREHIRFAALTLDGLGLAEFGDCFLVLKEDMIAHRATVFEENSASFLEYHGYKEPEGARATWEERFKLCIAKNAGDLRPGMKGGELAAILLRQKTSTEESRFVEVHIYGSLSIRAVEKVNVKKDPLRRTYKKSFVLALRDRAAKLGAVMEEI